MFDGIFFYGAFVHLHTPAGWLVGCGDNADDVASVFYQDIERGNGKFGCAHEDEAKVFVIHRAKVVSDEW